MRLITLALLNNYVKNIVRYKLFNNKNLHPLLPTLYLTTNCNFRCDYCDIYNEKIEEMNTEEIIKTMEIMRTGCVNIAFTGGEPFIKKDFLEIVKQAKRLNFMPIYSNTNGYFLEEKEEVLKYLDVISISLDTLNEKKQDIIFGVKGAAKKIKNNIIKYSKKQKELDIHININCVVNSNNIKDVIDIIKFASDNKVTFSVAPAISDFNPSKELRDNREYQHLIQIIIQMKKLQYPIINTIQYLRTIMNFDSFECLPSLTPRIAPNGDLYYPCMELKKTTTNILNYKTWDELIKDNDKSLLDCKRSCHYSCYLELSHAIQKPLQFQ